MQCKHQRPLFPFCNWSGIKLRVLSNGKGRRDWYQREETLIVAQRSFIRLKNPIARGWLENDEDQKNLLSSPWDHEGIGICIGPDGVLYVTMNFC
jgi:hypothetical protein